MFYSFVQSYGHDCPYKITSRAKHGRIKSLEFLKGHELSVMGRRAKVFNVDGIYFVSKIYLIKGKDRPVVDTSKHRYINLITFKEERIKK